MSFSVFWVISGDIGPKKFNIIQKLLLLLLLLLLSLFKSIELFICSVNATTPENSIVIN